MKSEIQHSKKDNEDFPFVSCIMPTYNRRPFVSQAITYFLRQDYPDCELIIIDDGTDPVGDIVPTDPRVRYLRLESKKTIGAKRNLACREAKGEIIVHWDDDDWMASWRLKYQVENLQKEQADICGLDAVLFFDPGANQSWQYIYPKGSRPWLAGGTLCYAKTFWSKNPFPDINIGEDARFVWNNRSQKMVNLQDNSFYVAMIHSGNSSPKRTKDHRWHSYSTNAVKNLMGEDWDFYAAVAQEAHPMSYRSEKSLTSVKHSHALVTAASGIGDILRMTPFIRILKKLGYTVDVLLAPDHLEVVKLLEHAPEIDNLFCLSNSHCSQKEIHTKGFRQRTYEVAIFTTWSLHLKRYVLFKRALSFNQQEWLREGDINCAMKIARTLGWQGDLPKPFAIPSARQFGLPPGTIAFHPGCKSGWPWKKWHGFAELAKLFPHVVVIGTPEDLNNDNTYFNKAFTWPKHVQNLVGKLSLSDTAALLKECTALVANDSGIMHLGVTLGIPTFGIFGITNSQRESMPYKNMLPVTKGLPCEQACRGREWGRRNCEHNLECLRTLTAQEVYDKITEIVPQTVVRDIARKDETMDELSLVYYGYVFDASGYGHAARAYVHALHAAGIRLSVVDLANHARQVRDELVESLVGKKITADFHLFHGIPPQWARRAFRHPNAIGMTVWETDVMPSQWRNVLDHVLEVWLPSEFNVSTFRKSLDTPIFKLPHAILPFSSNGNVPEPNQFLGVAQQDFIYYSIFEWQDRKSPQGLLESYLRAFPTETETVLLLKANSGAAEIARQSVDEARRKFRSEARILVHCEAWNEAQIEALHERGDCYVSLHRGEGWGYPLFEAARRGTPVIATNYSGPVDYLNPENHCLVQYTLGSVRQPYHYYHPQMRWAEPDLNHASELMRWVSDNRDVAKDRAAKIAKEIQRVYSLDTVGSKARDRLLTLLKKTQPEKWKRLGKNRLVSQLSPDIPIPPEWYDEDYFENGLKSNWDGGYIWPLYADLFCRTAEFLVDVFSEATSFLDIGCAKGFLVRTLREHGKDCWGFDHSEWAIDRVDESIRPFVIQASVDDVSYDRQFDVLLALSIFESLTESQIFTFLSKARAWTRQALFAVIPSFENEQEEENSKRSAISLNNRKITIGKFHAVKLF